MSLSLYFSLYSEVDSVGHYTQKDTGGRKCWQIVERFLRELWQGNFHQVLLFCAIMLRQSHQSSLRTVCATVYTP